MNAVHVIGAGLAGSEAAWQIAQADVPVVVHEMRPEKKTEAHKSDALAELVCSNSLRADDSDYNAVGLLHDEMRRCGSLIMEAADTHSVPAGGALAVDREGFSEFITERIHHHPLITVVREEIRALPKADLMPSAIVASGPLTSEPLAEAIQQETGEESLSFFDAIAPIVYKDSINMDRAWMQSRYDKPGPHGTGSDYINCPMNKEQYESFVRALLEAPKIAFKDWETNTPYFNGCLPIEVMAERGIGTLRYGPMKPVGLTNPHTPERPYAVVQLRQDNTLGTLYNLVGFQTKMKHADQTRVFRMIPGLENATFARLGGLHRNTFLNSPRLLDEQLRLKTKPHLRFAGQMTGVEGYVESAAMGLLTGLFAAAEQKGSLCPSPPRTTAMGALHAHLTGGADSETFQPMNVCFGLFPPPDTPQEGPRPKKTGGRARKLLYTQRAKKDFGEWLEKNQILGPLYRSARRSE
ncbi:MAG: methylenetetrahydrofolate--tRNA-(uracil(54)-C(5))-methyltransferase (FADH(2)-oxidizing) TrmFO [Alphaproteobacteria bacterium]|nr:methylenetetrahydrofolate--tRNA-(uracil(54)-C(5))-methyltransferase (FADH(2)-oxidizing) TrmFO [Alphaproteobacteria bacterium]